MVERACPVALGELSSSEEPILEAPSNSSDFNHIALHQEIVLKRRRCVTFSVLGRRNYRLKVKVGVELMVVPKVLELTCGC